MLREVNCQTARAATGVILRRGAVKPVPSIVTKIRLSGGHIHFARQELPIAAIIVAGTWNLFRQSLHLLFDGVPDGVDLYAVQGLLKSLPGVERVHDLHV